MSQEVLYVHDVADIGITLVDRQTRQPIPMPNASISALVQRPDRSLVTWTFAPVTNGSDGRFTYQTAGAPTPDLNQPGRWQVQPTPTDAVGPFAADPDTFTVLHVLSGRP